MNIGVITSAPSVICMECAADDKVDWATSDGYPDGFTCDDCGSVVDSRGEVTSGL